MNLQENIHRIKEMMGLREQEEKNLDTFIMVYPKGMGVEHGEGVPTSETHYIPLGNVLANEIFKDEDYFLNDENIQGMLTKLKGGEELKPIMVIQHPEDPDKFIVLDGHHRRYAYEKSDKFEIPVRIVEYDNILLSDENGKVLGPLNKLLGDRELLRQYFVSPMGTPLYTSQS